MPRIAGARKEDLPNDIRKAWEQQEALRGAPMPNLAIYALRPTIWRGHKALAAGIEESGLLPNELKNLVSLKAALINGCPF